MAGAVFDEGGLEGGVLEELANFGGEVGGVVGVEEEGGGSIEVLAADFGDGRGACGYNWGAAVHGLEWREAESFI